MDAISFTALLFVSGAVLTLERRCLGRMALVQPLALTVLVGVYTGQAELGLWLGICLQLFAIIPGNQADWALAGTIAAATMYASNLFGFTLDIGTATATLVIAITIGFGYLARITDRYFARFDGKSISNNCPLVCDDPVRRMSEFVFIRVTRSALLGGVEAIAGTAVTIFAALALEKFFGGRIEPTLFGIVAVPTVGVAAAIGALSGYRVIVLSGVSMAIAWAVML